MQFLQCMCGVVPAYQNQKYARKLSKCIEQYNTEWSCNGHSISFFFFLHTFFFIPSSLRLHLDACCRFLSFKGRDNRIFVKCLFFFFASGRTYIFRIYRYILKLIFFFLGSCLGLLLFFFARMQNEKKLVISSASLSTSFKDQRIYDSIL